MHGLLRRLLESSCLIYTQAIVLFTCISSVCTFSLSIRKLDSILNHILQLDPSEPNCMFKFVKPKVSFPILILTVPKFLELLAQLSLIAP